MPLRGSIAVVICINYSKNSMSSTLSAPFDPEDPKIKREILTMIVQYLEENGLRSSAVILRNEARFQVRDGNDRNADLSSVRSLVMQDKWEELDEMQIDKILPPRLVYAIYRHRFFELLLSDSATAALPFLSARLRPFRAFEDQAGDFDQLCFLVVDAASAARSLAMPDLDASLQRTLSAIDAQIAQITAATGDRSIPAGRLKYLAQQAAAFQLTNHPLGTISSLETDFVPALIPGECATELQGGHVGNVKAVSFVPKANVLLSGGSDANVCVWDVSKGTRIAKLKGHRSRVWDIATTDRLAATASGDGTIKIWDLNTFQNTATYSGHRQDVYSVDVDKGGRRIVSGGFDRTVVVWDVEAGVSVQTMKEHKGAVTSVCFDPLGTIIVSGGKDLQICIWDSRSCICVRTLEPVLGEVTSVCTDASFTRVLAATKNSTNRIWDLRMEGISTLLKGHQNFSKSFVRARFGHEERTVISGSDDGRLYCWDADSGILVEKQDAHSDGVCDVVYSEHLRVFASCGGDSVVKLWRQRPMK